MIRKKSKKGKMKNKNPLKKGKHGFDIYNLLWEELKSCAKLNNFPTRSAYILNAIKNQMIIDGRWEQYQEKLVNSINTAQHSENNIYDGKTDVEC